MLRIIFIGKQNHTNAIICNTIASNFAAEITFFDPKIIFSNLSISAFKKQSLVIIDLNTSSGYGSAPKNIASIYDLTESVPILVLDHYENQKFIHSLVEAGASGIISTTPSESNLIKAIKELTSGNKFVEIPE